MGTSVIEHVTARVQSGQLDAYWSGDLSQITALTAEPTVIERADDRAVIRCTGVLRRDALSRLAVLVACESRRPGTRLIYLWLDSICGELQGLRSVLDAIEAAGRRRVAVIAQIEKACGPALLIAMQCHIAGASPTAIIGRIACAVDPTVFTYRPKELRADSTLTEHLAASLSFANPDVPHEAWIALRERTVNGEAAEALRIVALVQRLPARPDRPGGRFDD